MGVFPAVMKKEMERENHDSYDVHDGVETQGVMETEDDSNTDTAMETQHPGKTFRQLLRLLEL